jgi:hypothetical protein
MFNVPHDHTTQVLIEDTCDDVNAAHNALLKLTRLTQELDELHEEAQFATVRPDEDTLMIIDASYTRACHLVHQLTRYVQQVHDHVTQAMRQ